MKRFAATVLSLSFFVVTFNSISQSETGSNKDLQISIARSGSQPSQTGAADKFAGSVQIDPLFSAKDPSRTSAGSVTFQPGARTAWHTHPLGQVLIVTTGIGLVQSWGGPIEEIRKGDVVRILPNVKHWHGASPNSEMTHIAVQEEFNGTTVKWLEKVTDEQYRKEVRP